MVQKQRTHAAGLPAPSEQLQGLALAIRDADVDAPLIVLALDPVDLYFTCTADSYADQHCPNVT